jgi:hypothetical protein
MHLTAAGDILFIIKHDRKDSIKINFYIAETILIITRFEAL